MDFAYDKSIIVTGNEINEYFVVVLKALGMYKKELADATTHIGHGMVRLPEGKMSSRTGKIIRGEWVLNESKKRALEIINKNEKFDNSKEDKEDVAENIAQGAVKYAFLKQGIGNNISFDFETSLSFDGNSGPYLQYTYARCQSVLTKSTLQGSTLQGQYSKLELNSEELSLLRTFIHFPEVIKKAAESYSPNIICSYLYDLAQKYNFFYNKHRILGGEDGQKASDQSSPVTQAFRVALTSATGQILKTGLNLLGIKAPERM
jgi:arginyl-tRNA synthetase